LFFLIKNLPDSVREATDYDRLAVFAGNPEDFDNLTMDADDLWEMVLNQQLKSVFGWGMEENMEDIICRGRKGLDGLANFVRYFVVKRGVSEDLFEGKLSHLMMTLSNKGQSMIFTYKNQYLIYLLQGLEVHFWTMQSPEALFSSLQRPI
jgi:hypothetical protein